MRAKLITYVICLFAALAACVLTGLACFGNLSLGEPRSNDRNIFGGFGAIRLTARSGSGFVPMLCDDVNIYYLKNITAGEDTVQTLYSYNPETHAELPVCMRPMCTHTDRDCLIAPLRGYEDDGSLDYWCADGRLFYRVKEDDVFKIYAWDSLTDKRSLIFEAPTRVTLIDENGGEIQIGVDAGNIWRISGELLIGTRETKCCLFDNDFNELGSFPQPSGTFLAWTDDSLYWENGRGDFARYDIKTGETEYSIIKNALGEAVSVSREYYCYNGRLYFESGGIVRAYDAENGTVKEITKIKLPPDFGWKFSVFDRFLFFFSEDDKVTRFNLNSGEIAVMSEMPSLPCAATEKYLIMNYIDEETGTWDNYAAFDYDGRRV